MTVNTKNKIKIYVKSQNNFSVLNRIVNILNRRRIRIISLFGREDELNIYKGHAEFIIYADLILAKKAISQIEKVIEVEEVKSEILPD